MQSGLPKRKAATASALRLAIGERLDHLAIVPNRDVQMRELGVAGQADMAKFLTGGDRVARLHDEAAFGHVPIDTRPLVGHG